MKILVTGAKGFIGKNLLAELRNRKYTELYEFDLDTPHELLDHFCGDCDFVFHLAGVNRPKEQEEYMQGNYGLTALLLDALQRHGNTCPVMLSSSIQAALDNPYGRSKKAGEDLLLDYGKAAGAQVLVYRFPNVFGKWCRPNYNSAVATFCHNVAHGLPITVNDPGVTLRLVYIDDVVDELLNALNGKPHREDVFCSVPIVHTVTLGSVAELIRSFGAGREKLDIADMADSFTKKLYATYLSYLSVSGFSYPLTMHTDVRGSFTEFVRTPERGQFSVNISKPGITKGNHWHHTKNEKFLVVSGNGVIRFRQYDTEQIIEYQVSGNKLEVVDIPPGYTHNIENTGDTDMVTLMWASECFDPEKPDTYYLEV